MPITYHCDTTTHVTVSLWRGRVPLEDITSHLDVLASDPDFVSSRVLLTDLRDIASNERPTLEQVERAAQEFLRRFGDTMTALKWGIVARHAFLEASAFEERIREHVARALAFNDLGTACVWLGVDPTQIEKTIDELRDGAADELRA